MEIRNLTTFIRVAELQSFSRAAEQLGYSQSAVTVQIRQLEQEEAHGKPWFGGDLNPKNYIHLSGRDAKSGDTYRGHPTQVVAAVSGAMGHNRLEIVFSHYNYTE